LHNSVLHEVLMDVVGRDTVDSCQAAQAVRSVGEAAGDAAFGAADQPVLAVPDVCPAAGVGQGVAIGIARHGGRTCAVPGGGSQAVTRTNLLLQTCSLSSF